MNYIIKRYSILSLLLLLCGIVGQAQTLVFEKNFKDFFEGNGNFLLGENESDFPGWTFINCERRTSGYLRVADTSEGWFETEPFVGLNGNALIALRIKVPNETSVKVGDEFNVTISIKGSGSLRQTDYCIIASNDNKTKMFGLPIYLYNGASDTQIKVRAAAGNKVYIESIRVYDIGDAIFYESFDLMTSTGEFRPSNGEADYHLFDNSEGAIGGSDVTGSLGGIFIGKGNSSYNMPTIQVTDDTNYLLSFQMSQYDNNGAVNQLSVSCSGSAKATMFNGALTPKTSQSASFSGGGYNMWQSFYTVISGMTNSTILTIGGYQIFLDNILLTPIPTLLDEAANNITYIKGHAGQTTDVKLRRTLTVNVWCPLCLPFDVTPESFATAANAVVADANPVLRTFTSVSEGVFTFDVVPAATTIAAGTPFLVKVTKQVTNPTFAGVTVVNTPAVAVPANSDYQFVGTYSPVNLNTDGTHLFLGTDGTLYKPGTTAGYNHMNGLRAYFQIPAAASGTRISLPGDETTAIQDINDDDEQFEHRFDSEAVRTQNLLPRQITIREGRKYLSK